MDVRMKPNSQLQLGTNEATGHNPGDELKFLSQEEQDILHFFEQTIDSLEQSLEEDELRPQIKSLNNSAHVVDGASSTGPNLHANPKEQDIIDLVRPKPDLIQTKDTTFTPTSPDFQSLIQYPESHFEIKPRNEQVDSLPLSDYNPPSTENYPTYHPPGSIPTPVLIAQKIAENQAGGGSSIISASSLLRRRSSEFDKSTSTNKQGPPTSTKPARYPANINVILGNREQQNQSLANINIEERRAQMLANLSGTSHPLVQEESQQDQKERNTPTRSVSFRDPTPEKSRMEALSKLGLTRSRALSGGVSLPSTALEPLSGVAASTTKLEKTELTNSSMSQVSNPATLPNMLSSTDGELSTPSHSLVSSKQPEIMSTPNVVPITTPQEQSIPHNTKLLEPSSPSTILTTSSNVSETKHRSPVVSYGKQEIPPPDVQKNLESSYSPPSSFSQKDDFLFPPAPPPVEIGGNWLPEFNSYGGKSIVVNPSASFKSDSPSSPVSPEPKSIPPVIATPSEFNAYGGKSKVMTPITVPVSRRDLPDILSSHIDKTHIVQKPSENVSSGSNSYGGKSVSINPSGSARRPSDGLPRTSKPPAPLPAARPPRHSYHGPTVMPKSSQRSLSPEHKRRTGSLFRPQGITVHFSGKGPTDELRREALRKLGLLKD